MYPRVADAVIYQLQNPIMIHWVKEALDIVRVIGNNAVHPGQIDLQDNDETAKSLFGLVNIISEKMITEPKHVKSMFDNLPDNAKNQIKKRDEK